MGESEEKQKDLCAVYPDQHLYDHISATLNLLAREESRHV